MTILNTSYRDFHMYKVFRDITMKTFNLHDFSSCITDTLHSITSSNPYVYYKKNNGNYLVKCRQKTIYGVATIKNWDRIRNYKHYAMFDELGDYKLHTRKSNKLSVFRKFKR